MEQTGDPKESSPPQGHSSRTREGRSPTKKEGFRFLQCGCERGPRKKQSGDSTAPGLRPPLQPPRSCPLRAGSTTQSTRTGNASSAHGATGTISLLANLGSKHQPKSPFHVNQVKLCRRPLHLRVLPHHSGTSVSPLPSQVLMVPEGGSRPMLGLASRRVEAAL